MGDRPTASKRGKEGKAGAGRSGSKSRSARHRTCGFLYRFRFARSAHWHGFNVAANCVMPLLERRDFCALV